MSSRRRWQWNPPLLQFQSQCQSNPAKHQILSISKCHKNTLGLAHRELVDIKSSMSGPTLDEMVGSMAFRSRTSRPSLQKVRLARGSKRPGSMHLHLTSGPTFSFTSNRTIPPSTTNSSPTLTSVNNQPTNQVKVLHLQPSRFQPQQSSFHRWPWFAIVEVIQRYNGKWELHLIALKIEMQSKNACCRDTIPSANPS